MSDGMGCTCAAYCERDCACDVDWTPQELIDARERIAALEEAQRWIPVSERLPPFETRILASYPNHDVVIVYLIDGFSDHSAMTHWLPLPAPPEEQGE